jgi:hypothetical protein
MFVSSGTLLEEEQVETARQDGLEQIERPKSDNCQDLHFSKFY